MSIPDRPLRHDGSSRYDQPCQHGDLTQRGRSPLRQPQQYRSLLTARPPAPAAYVTPAFTVRKMVALRATSITNWVSTAARGRPANTYSTSAAPAVTCRATGRLLPDHT